MGGDRAFERTGHLGRGLGRPPIGAVRRVTLTADDIAGLTIADSALSYDGDGRLLRLGLQAYALGIAYEFEPRVGLSISPVDPLPHQLEAVYEHLLKLPSVRFLLADDAGAGKTIMPGLLIRELKLRGLIERVLVVCPANLTSTRKSWCSRAATSAISSASTSGWSRGRSSPRSISPSGPAATDGDTGDGMGLQC